MACGQATRDGCPPAPCPSRWTGPDSPPPCPRAHARPTPPAGECLRPEARKAPPASLLKGDPCPLMVVNLRGWEGCAQLLVPLVTDEATGHQFPYKGELLAHDGGVVTPGPWSEVPCPGNRCHLSQSLSSRSGLEAGDLQGCRPGGAAQQAGAQGPRETGWGASGGPVLPEGLAMKSDQGLLMPGQALLSESLRETHQTTPLEASPRRCTHP